MKSKGLGFLSRKKKEEEVGVRRGLLRTNLEAFTVAIVMAIVIKTYAFEAFQVPTESMEPTIIGRAAGGDRIIVNRFKYEMEDPERYDGVVFRYPLSRMLNYVKRLVGLPGETLKIGHGDIYTSDDDGESFNVARKPRALAETIFEQNPVIPEKSTDRIAGGWVRNWFNVPTSRVRIDNADGVIRMDAGEAELTLVSKPGKLFPERRDRYADSRGSRGDEALKDPVSDLRFDLTVTPESGVEYVLLQLLDGTQPKMPLRLQLAVEGGGGTSSLTHGEQQVEPGTLAEVTLPTGEESELRFSNCDDRVVLQINGDDVLVYEYSQHHRNSVEGNESQIKFGLIKGKGVISHIALCRDLYYTLYDPMRKYDFQIPEGHYLFFGDNSPNSLDARGWRVVGIRLREDGRILLGDLEAVSDSFKWPRRDNNPYFETEGRKILDPDTHRFLDIYGNEWKLESGSYDILDLAGFDVPEGSPDILKLHGTTLESPEPGQLGFERVTSQVLKQQTDPAHARRHAFRHLSRLMHFVPRDNIMGQANIVFWPAKRWGAIR